MKLEVSMVRVKVGFNTSSEEGRMVCDAIDRAKGSPLLEDALQRQLHRYLLSGLATIRSVRTGEPK